MAKISGIQMTEENRRFSVDESCPIEGHIAIYTTEGPDKVEAVFTAEGLRALDSRRFVYRLMLLGLKNGQSLHIDIAEFQADERGNAEIRFELNCHDADGRGNALGDFFVFMVIAASLGSRTEPYHPVLKGDWKYEMPASEPEKKQGCFNGYYEEYIIRRTAELIMKREQFSRMQIFEETWLADTWRIAENAEDFPVASIDAADSIAQNGHFIFAYNDEFLLLGVPGTGEKARQPDGGTSGFTMWQPAKGSDLHGYWLTAVRRKTGEIVGI